MAKAAPYLFFFVSILPGWAFGQAEADSLRKARALVADHKYESAFEVLENTDPKNRNPDMVLLKEEIALNYFVMSLNHKAFSLRDIGKEEDIIQYRGENGNSFMHLLPLAEILDTLIRRHPANYALRNGLGRYYDEVETRYKGRWEQDDAEVHRRMIENYRLAAAHDVQDYHPYYSLGLDEMYGERWQDGIAFLKKATRLAPEFADGHYNLAYGYMQVDSLDRAIWHGNLALDLYKDSTYRADAARMLAQAYVGKRDESNALRYYLISNAFDPDNFYTLRPLLQAYVKTGHVQEAATREDFFRLDPANPTIYNTLEDIYGHSGKLPVYIEFLKSKLPAYRQDHKVFGNLNFFLGRAYLTGDTPADKALAHTSLTEAKAAFLKVYPKDHPVFAQIEEGMKKARPKK